MMKKFLFATLMATALCGCGQSAPKVEFAANMEEFKTWRDNFMAKYRAAGANQDSLAQVYDLYIAETAKQHIGDSMGLQMTIEMAYEMNMQELDSVLNLCDLYKSNERLNRLKNAKIAEEATAAGSQYIDFEGNNVTTGKKMKLSDFVKNGKPTIVDFWASWCGPCRAEIKNALAAYAAKYSDKVNFVGVAVWEESIDDTKKAMSQLPISWPILFAGGRKESPTEQYGIMGIPHIMLIDTDGTIKARGLRGAAIEEAILEVLNNK